MANRRSTWSEVSAGLLITFFVAWFGTEYADQLMIGLSGVAITLILVHWAEVRRAGKTISAAVGTTDRLMADSELWGQFLGLAREALKVRNVEHSLVHDSQQEALMRELVVCREALIGLTSGRFDHDERGRILAMIRAFGKATSIQALSHGNFLSWWSQGVVANDYAKANREAIKRGAEVDRIFVISSVEHLDQIESIVEAQLRAGVTVRLLSEKAEGAFDLSAILRESSNFAVFDDELVSVETRLGERVKGFLSNRELDVVEFRERWDTLRASSTQITSKDRLGEFLAQLKEAH
jgi:hypothetical protein